MENFLVLCSCLLGAVVASYYFGWLAVGIVLHGFDFIRLHWLTIKWKYKLRGEQMAVLSVKELLEIFSLPDYMEPCKTLGHEERPSDFAGILWGTTLYVDKFRVY